MQQQTVTVKLTVQYRDYIHLAEVVEDLRKQLNRNPPCEQAPFRHVTGGGWWTRSSTVTAS